MTQEEFNKAKLYLEDNQIELLLKNFGLLKIKEVLDDIYHSGSFYETYEYYNQPSTDIDKKLILRQIDHFSAMDFIYDLRDSVQIRLDELEIN